MSDDSIYKSAAAHGGWSFEKSNQSPFECQWKDIYIYIKEHHDLKGYLVLDMGSAEGLKFMSIADQFLLGVGIDREPKMLQLALKNASQFEVQNVRFFSMDSNRLQFPDEFFDFLICRHAPFDLPEVHRVLRKGGIFATQQVHERDKQNLKEHFGRGQNYKVPSDASLQDTLKQGKKVGFKCVYQKFSDLDYYFNSKSHLIDFLKKTPVIPDYSSEKEANLTDTFIQTYQSQQGIKSNSARTLLVLKK